MECVTWTHKDGTVRIEELSSGKRRVSVDISDKSMYVQHLTCETAYSDELIAAVLKLKGLNFLCDEIMRDENPGYVSAHLSTAILAHMPAEAFNNKLILDFGCGSGASTMILARLLPNARVVGVELVPESLVVAEARAKYYGLPNIRFLASPSGSEIPKEVDKVDFVVLSGVYEHLLPDERRQLLPQLWSKLQPGGVLFIDETPHRFFPIETHTTGLPLINYLPSRMVLAINRRFAKRNMDDDAWEVLLRKGIRGGTIGEILGILKKTKHSPPVLLNPTRLGIRDQADLWYEGYVRFTVGRSPGIKKLIWLLLKPINLVGIQWAPYLTLAIKKT